MSWTSNGAKMDLETCAICGVHQEDDAVDLGCPCCTSLWIKKVNLKAYMFVELVTVLVILNLLLRYVHPSFAHSCWVSVWITLPVSTVSWASAPLQNSPSRYDGPSRGLPSHRCGSGCSWSSAPGQEFSWILQVERDLFLEDMPRKAKNRI